LIAAGAERRQARRAGARAAGLRPWPASLRTTRARHPSAQTSGEMRELRVTANGLNFRCLAAGPEAGELALLLHGFPEGAESWSAQLDVLGEAGFLAIPPDLPAHAPP